MTKYILSLSLIFTALATLPASAIAKPKVAHHVIHAWEKSWSAPLLALPKWTLPIWTCILNHESRSTFAKPNLGDNNSYGSSGIFQIEQITWSAHQLAAGVSKTVHVWQATALEQAKVAVAIFKADGFSLWADDGCEA